MRPRIYWCEPSSTVHGTLFQEGHAVTLGPNNIRIGFRMYTIRQDKHDRSYYVLSGPALTLSDRDITKLRQIAEETEQRHFDRMGF